MAIQATFTADTRPLEQGMERVAASIAKTKRATGDADRSLKAMGSAFDGTRLEGTALRMAEGVRKVGGAAKLTADEFRRVERAVDGALDAIRIKGGAANVTLVNMKRELDGIKASADGAGSRLSAGLGALASGLGVGVGAGLGLGAITAIGGALRDIAAEGARIGPLAQSFERMQGGSVAAERALVGLRQATRGLVSDADLLQAANKGSLLGLDAMGIKFDEVARVATVLGRAMGQDAAKSVDDLTTALSRMSPQILDNLGIKVDLAAATEAYAKSIGKTADALTEEERKLAFATAAMDAAQAKAKVLGDQQLTLWEQTTRVTTALSGMAVEMVTAGNQTQGLSGLVGNLANTLERLRASAPAAVRQLRSELDLSLKAMVQFGGSGGAAFGGGPFGGLIQSYLGARMGGIDPVELSRLGAAQRGGDIVLRSPVASGTASRPAAGTGTSRASAAASTARAVKTVSEAQRELNRDVAEAYRVTAQATQGWEEYGGAIDEAALMMLAYAEANQKANLGTIKEASNPFNSIMNGPYFQQITDGAPRQAAATARSWQTSMRGVVQAFASLAQIAGPSLDGVTRGLGTVIASADASTQLVEALGERFSGLTDKASGNLSAGGRALSGGLAGLTTGLQIGGLFTNRGAGFAAGAVSGAATGAMAGGFIGAGVGAVVGGLAGLYSANQNRKAQAQQMEAMRQQIIASYGTLDDFKRVVERTGYSWEYFTSLFNSNKPETFQRAVTSLNTAIAEQKARADKLVVSLNKVAAAQGVLSQSQLAQMRLTRPGDPGYDEINAFLEGQVAQAESGIVAAVDALGRYTGNALWDFGGSVNAAAAGLAALFGEAVARGESAVQIIGRLGGAMGTLQGIYERNGGTMPTGLAGISDLAGIVNGQNTGIAVQTASGLGSALAGFQNTGVFAAMPELFTDIANGIGSAWRALEQFGGGGQRGLAIFAPYLQTLWEILDANPQLRSQLDEQTRSLLELAEANGVVGAAQRDAAEKQIEAIDRLIAKLDEWLSKLGQVANAPMPAGPAGPPTGTGTPGGGNGGSGGDYDGFAIGSGGVRDFGRESLVRLHGREAVLTEAQYDDLQARARMGVRMSAPAWGGSMRVEAPVYLNARRVGLGVAEVTPGLLQTYGVR
jgi:hypothetical protein